MTLNEFGLVKTGLKLNTANPSRFKALAVLVACACAVFAGRTHAEESTIPAYLTMSLGLTHDDNVNRNDLAKVADTIATATVGGGLDKSYGRQHYNLSAQVSKNKYKNVSLYDNDSYQLGASLESGIGADFQLSLSGSAAQELAKTEENINNSQRRNLVSINQYNADLRYGLYGRMSINGFVNYSKVDFESTVDQNRDTKSAGLGLRYSPSDLVYFGLGLSRSNTNYKNLEFVYVPKGEVVAEAGFGEEVERTSLNVNGNWAVTGFSIVGGSVGYTVEEYRYDWRRDFKGVTGGLSWKFTPQGKLTYLARWSRDTNNAGGSNFAYTFADYQGGVVPAGVYNAVTQVADNYSLRVDYSVTSKISSYLDFALKDSKIQKSTLSSVGNVYQVESQDSKYQSVVLGIGYRPIDAVYATCSLRRYKQDKSISYAADASGRVISCQANFTVQ